MSAQSGLNRVLASCRNFAYGHYDRRAEAIDRLLRIEDAAWRVRDCANVPAYHVCCSRDDCGHAHCAIARLERTLDGQLCACSGPSMRSCPIHS